jgi:tetratricopeptide (TPR) repeat protein
MKLPEAIRRYIPHHIGIRRGILLSILGVLIVVAATTWIRGFSIAPQTVVDDGYYNYFMDLGVKDANLGEYDDAMDELHSAIDEARTSDEKALAGLQMGRILTDRARVQSGPYALMAEQYYLAAMNAVQPQNPIRQKAIRMLLEASGLAENRTRFDRMAQELLNSTSDQDDRQAIYIQWIKDGLSAGTYAETIKLMKEATAKMPGDAAQGTLGFLNIEIAKKLLQNDDWFQEYKRQYSDRTPADLKAEIVNVAVRWLENKGRQNPKLSDECDFQMASIYYAHGDWSQAKSCMRGFLTLEPTVHKDESLLMMTGLLRREGELESADQIMRTYVRKYGVTEAGCNEVQCIVDLLEGKGQFKEAYQLLKVTANETLKGKHNNALLVRAAKMAGRLGLNADAWEIYRGIKSSNSRTPGILNLLIEEADMNLARNEIAEAKKWLTEYLRSAPPGENRAEGLFRLFRLKQKENTSMVETLVTGIAASRANPEHPSGIETIMDVAKDLESIGLYNAAVARFSQVSVLEHVGMDTNSQALVNMVGQACVGEARCLLESGDKVKADRRCREICRERCYSSAIRSEAAYWWATIAMDEGQGREALRRLSIMKTNGLESSMICLADIENNTGKVLTGEDWKQAVDCIFQMSLDLNEDERKKCLARSCHVLFIKFDEDRNVNAMQYVVDKAASSPIGEGPFFKELLFKLATTTINDRNGAVMANFMKQYIDGPKNGIQTVSREESMLMDIYRQFVEIQPEVKGCL